MKVKKLKIYKGDYITKNYKYQQADIVYKLKEKDVYFLIEHQTKVDYSMPYRILNYCVEIIRSAVDENKMKKEGYQYPIVIPIVLYTGNQKWNASTIFPSIFQNRGNSGYKTVEVKYQLIDINDYEVEELLKEKTMLANAMILEKCQNNDEVIKNLKRIIENLENDEELKQLKRIVAFLYQNMEEQNIREIIRLIEESESEESMSTIAERLKEEFINERKQGLAQGLAQGIAQGLAQGLAQGITEVIERMVRMNLEDDFIKRATGAKKSEIKQIREKISKT